MSIKRSAISGLAFALVGSLALTACGGSDDGDGDGGGGGNVTLDFTWWGGAERAERYEEAIALFEEANPNIDVQTSFAEFPDYWTQRSTDATSGELPDVLQMDASRLLEYADNGLLYDMSEFEGDALDTSAIDEQLLNSGRVNEQLVAIATGTNTLALIVNPDLMAELGIEAPDWDYTWDDYNALLAEGTAAGADMDPRIYGGGEYATVWWLFMQDLVQQGIEPFAENGEMNFDEDDMRAFLNRTADLREEGIVFPIERNEQLSPLNDFSAGETPMAFHWDNFVNGWSAELGNENLELLPVPSGADGQKHQFFKPTMQLSIGQNTSHPEEAAMLVDFLINSPEAGQIIGTDLGVPSSQTRLDALEIEEGSLDQKIIDYQQRARDEGAMTATVPVQPAGFGGLETEYVEVLGNELSYGQIDVDEFVERFFSEAENLLVTS